MLILVLDCSVMMHFTFGFINKLNKLRVTYNRVVIYLKKICFGKLKNLLFSY